MWHYSAISTQATEMDKDAMQKQENAQDWLQHLGRAHVPFCFSAVLGAVRCSTELSWMVLYASEHCDVSQERQLKLDSKSIHFSQRNLHQIRNLCHWTDVRTSSVYLMVWRSFQCPFCRDFVRFLGFPLHKKVQKEIFLIFLFKDFLSSDKLHSKYFSRNNRQDCSRFVSQFLCEKQNTKNHWARAWKSVIVGWIKSIVVQKPSTNGIDKSNWDSTTVRKL